MTRIMIGGLVAMSIALATSLVALRASWQEAANERRDAAIARNEAEGTALVAKRREQALLARIEGVEKAVSGMQTGLRQNSELLNDQLKRLYEIPQTEGQTDEDLECLDARVPGVVSELLRSAIRRADHGPAAGAEDPRRADPTVPAPGLGGNDLP